MKKMPTYQRNNYPSKTNAISICLWLLTFFLILFLSVPTSPAANRKVKIGVYENAPKVFTAESGKPSGIFIDIIEYIAKEEGWDFQYVKGTWAQGLERLAKGEIDLMPDVAYAEANLYTCSSDGLQKIKEAFDRDPKLTNLLLDPYFKGKVQKAQPSWRQGFGAFRTVIRERFRG